MNSNLDRLSKIPIKSIVILSSMGPVYLDSKTFNGKDKARIHGLGIELVTQPELKNHYDIFKIGIKNTLDELLLNENLLIFFAMDVPELGIDNGCQNLNKEIIFFNSVKFRDLAKKTKFSNCNVKRDDYDERASKYKKLITEVLEEYPNVKLFDPSRYFCDLESNKESI